MKKKTSVRARLTLLTSAIILSFLTLFTILFVIFIKYFSHIIEKVYGIDDDILTPIIRIFLLIIIIMIAIAVLASVLGGHLAADSFLNTVSRFTGQISDIKEEGLKGRLEITSQDELALLGIQFNSLMEAMENLLAQQNQFVSDASHELKTPLSILKVNIEMLQKWGSEDKDILEETLEVLRIEVERMNTLTQELLTLTGGQADSQSEIQAVDGGVISELINDFRLLNKEAQITVQVKEGTFIPIKKEHLRQLLIVFLDNAVKYSKEDTTQKIEIKCDNNSLCIKDYGIGIKPEHLDKIFDRFYRVDESRKNIDNSFGLGLSIAKKICDQYGFQITVESEWHKYTIFTVKFE